MKPLITLGCRVALLAALTPSLVSAQQPPPQPDNLLGKSLEELMSQDVESVTGAARHEQRVIDAPASVTIVTARDIETFGWRTLADVLRAVRGFHVTYDRNYAYLGVRGFGRPTDYNNRVLIQVDGHRVNDTIYDGAYIGTEFPLDLSLVDRIEVIRGPGSALYGTSAFFAVVNVITRHGAGQRGRLDVDGGTLESYRGTGSFGWGDGTSRDVLVSVSRLASRGNDDLYFAEFDRPETNHGRALNLDGDERTSVYSAATFGRWRTQALFGTRTKAVPTASWSTLFNDPNFETTDSRGWVDLTYDRPLGAANISARAYYDYYGYRGDYPYEEGADVVVSDDGARADWAGGELTARRTVWGRHALTAGVEYRFNPRQQQWNYYGSETIVEDRRRSSEAAGYLQDEISINPRLTAVVGARYDWWSLKGGTGRPRAGIVYRPDFDSAVKVLYGEAYRAPNLYELYYGAYDDTSRANDGLIPETLRTTEFVYEQHVNRRIRVAMSAYYTRISNLIDQIADEEGAVTHINEESVRATGVELEAEGRWSSGVQVRASVSFQEADNTKADETLSNAPHRLGTLHVAVPLWRRQLLLATEALFTSERRTVTGVALDGYGLLNVTLTSRPIGSRVTIGGSIYNIFDKTYLDPVGAEFVQYGIPQDGRTASVRVNVRF